MKVVAVLPEGGKAAKNEKYVNCVENALGLREWCEKNKAELVVTASKDGDDSGWLKLQMPFSLLKDMCYLCMQFMGASSFCFM